MDDVIREARRKLTATASHIGGGRAHSTSHGDMAFIKPEGITANSHKVLKNSSRFASKQNTTLVRARQDGRTKGRGRETAAISNATLPDAKPQGGRTETTDGRRSRRERALGFLTSSGTFGYAQKRHVNGRIFRTDARSSRGEPNIKLRGGRTGWRGGRHRGTRARNQHGPRTKRKKAGHRQTCETLGRKDCVPGKLAARLPSGRKGDCDNWTASRCLGMPGCRTQVHH